MKPMFKKYIITMAMVWISSFLALFLFYIFVMSPQNKTKKDMYKQLEEKQNLYESALQAANKETQEKMRGQIDELRAKLNRFVLNPEELSNLVFDITRLAKERKVSSFSIKSGDKTSSTKILSCEKLAGSKIDLSFNGGFKQFAMLLNALERNKPVVFVDKFSIQQSNNEENEHQVNMDVSVFIKQQQDS